MWETVLVGGGLSSSRVQAPWQLHPSDKGL